MCENLFNLPGLPAPADPAPQPDPPLTGEQSDMFERWEKFGLSGLFEAPDENHKEPVNSRQKEPNHV